MVQRAGRQWCWRRRRNVLVDVAGFNEIELCRTSACAGVWDWYIVKDAVGLMKARWMLAHDVRSCDEERAEREMWPSLMYGRFS